MIACWREALTHLRPTAQMMFVGLASSSGVTMRQAVAGILTRFLAYRLGLTFLRWAAPTPAGAPWPASN
jgi:hypothetical protein